MSNPMALRDGVGESSSRRTRETTFDGMKELLNAHYDRFPSRYESEVYLPEDVLVHMDLLTRAEQSHNLVHKIWVDKPASNCHKVAFASSYELDRHSKLSSILSANKLRICKADTFPTSDHHYSLDLFLVEGCYGMNIQELSRTLEDECTKTEEPNNDIDMELLAIGERISPDHAHLYGGTYQAKEIVLKELQIDRTSFVSRTFWRGMEILSGLRHPHVVRCLGANTRTLTEGTLGIVTEYIGGGNLFDYLQRNHENLTLSQRLNIAVQISEGIEYLHEQLIIHKDINSSNILMDTDNVVKVDLPTSMYMAWAGKDIIPQFLALFHAFQALEMNTPKIRRWCKFTAPEAMNNREFDDRSDVYSFGIVLCTIITAKLPYETLDRLPTRNTALRVIEGQRPELPRETNPRLKKLIDECLDGDAMYRPHISEVRRVLESLVSELNRSTPIAITSPTTSTTPSTSNSASTLVLRNRFEALSNDLDS